MSVRNHDWGYIEYATAAEGLGEQLWALAWQQENYASIRPGWVITLAGLVVPGNGGGTVRITYDLTYDTVTQAEADTLHGDLSEKLTNDPLAVPTDQYQEFTVV